jgi:hypothetical protein
VREIVVAPTLSDPASLATLKQAAREQAETAAAAI